MINNKTTDILKEITIRNLKYTDLPALEWDGEYSHFRRVYEDAYTRAQQGLSILWVADLHGAGILGQVFVQLTCDRPELADGVNRAYFYSFRVRTKYQSMGIGSLLLKVLEDDLLRRGFKEITLNVAKENVRAQAFYKRHNYHIVAHEEGRWSYPDQDGVWHEVVEPAWRMVKRLK